MMRIARSLKFCLLTCTALLALFVSLSFYDYQWGNNDGLIKACAFRNWLYLLLAWTVLVSLCVASLHSSRSWLRAIGTHMLSGIGTVLLLEVSCGTLAYLDVLPISLTHYRLILPTNTLADTSRYAGDYSRLAGRWRKPNAHQELINCERDSLHRSANQWGAADGSRRALPPSVAKGRILVLGDSFVEGYMVDPPNRMTDLLEQQTGREHLNFGINGSAPISYWLRYKEYGTKLAHEAVMVGILPGNDFEEYTPATAYELIDSPLYRPYYSGTYPDFTLRYSLADISQSIAAPVRTPVRLRQTLDSVYRVLPLTGKLRVHLMHSYLVQTLLWLGRKGNPAKKQLHTRYTTFTDADWLTMQYSLEQIKRQAGSRPVILYSIPILSDLAAIRAGSKNRFDPRMATFCRANGIRFIPLLPHFLTYKGNVNDLYVPCDGHWSKRGERFVADIFLQEHTYQELIR